VPGMVCLSSYCVRVFYNEVKFGCEGIVGMSKYILLFFVWVCIWEGLLRQDFSYDMYL